MKFQDAKKYAVAKFTSPSFIKRIKEEDETMIKYLNILKQINNYGYITSESQGGHKITGKHYETHKNFEIYERAYISGFMLESVANEFIKNMGIHTDKIATYVAHCNDDVYVPSNLDIPLTITKKSGKVEVNTHTSLVLPYSVWESYRKELHINKSEKIVYIICWDPKWVRDASNNDGLFSDVLKVLKKISYKVTV